TQDLKTRALSSVLSGKVASLKCTGEVVTQGLIGAKTWLDFQAPNHTVDISGKIGGYGFVKIDIGNALDNLGEVMAGRQLFLNGGLLQNEEEGIVYTERDLQVTTDEAINRGIQIARNAEFNIANTFENQGG